MRIVNKAKILAELRTQYEIVPELQFLRSQAKQYVPGKGPLSTKVAVLGEAPGGTEDDIGEPFIGPAGRVLTRLLQEQGIGRDTVWITNIVKYRPPNNRQPTPAEISASQPFLVTELTTVKVSHVILLGRSAMSAMGIANPVVSQLHGTSVIRTMGSREFKLHLTYHPAAALRDRSNMEILRADFLKIFGEIKDGT
jgi:DNA polymerase